MARAAPRVLVLQWLILLAPLALVAAGAGYVWQKHQWAHDKLAEFEPRYARLQGLIDAQGDIDNLGQSAAQSIARFAYPGGRDPTEVGNEAQQAIRAIMADARLDVQSIQVQPPKEGKTFHRIPIALRMEGDMASLQVALTRLAAQTPAVLVDSFTVSLSGPARPAAVPRLSIQLNVSVLTARPA